MNDPEKVKPTQFNKIAAQGSHRRSAPRATTRAPHAQWKGSQHESRNVSCTTCHSIHHPMSPTAQLKAVEPADAVHVRAIATRWPSSIAPATCRCAKARWSARRATTRTARPTSGCCKTGNSINESCTSCHAEKRGPFLFEHAGINGDSCATCHDPHGSNNDRMLVAKLPFLCQRCHNHTRHPSTIYDNKVVSSSNRLFSRSCVTCHSAIHGSNHPSGSTFLRQ